MVAQRPSRTKAAFKGKDTRLIARISTSEKLLLKKAAMLTGQSISAFVITQAREAATLLVESPRITRLDAKESRRLVDALMAPPKAPAPAFKKALKAYRERVISDVNPRSPRARKS